MSKVIFCLCGLLRFEHERCLLCEGDDDEDDLDAMEAIIDDGFQTHAGDPDDTRRIQYERNRAMFGMKH